MANEIVQTVDTKNERILVYFIWTAIILRIGCFFFADNAGGDAIARATLAQQFLLTPGWQVHFDAWLPLHIWLIAAMGRVIGNVFLAGRLLSLICGILSVPAFASLARRLFGLRAAVYSTAVFATYTLAIAYSATSSCDICFIFFVLAGLDCFFRWIETSKGRYMLLSAISLQMSCAIRYEGWSIAFFLVCVVMLALFGFRPFTVRLRKAQAIGFIAVSAVWPIFWMAADWVTYGKILYAVSMNHGWVADQLARSSGGSLLYRIALTPGVLMLTLMPLTVIAALIALARVASPYQRLFRAIVLFVIAIQAYQVLSGGVMSFARYTLLIGSLIAVISGFGFAWVERFNLKPARVFYFACALLTLNSVAIEVGSLGAGSLSAKLRSIAPISKFPQHIDQAGSFVKRVAGTYDLILIDDYNYEGSQVAYVSGRSILDKSSVLLVPDDTDVPAQNNFLRNLPALFASSRPKWVVFSDEGVLRSALPLNAVRNGKFEDSSGDKFQQVFSNSRYRVFEVEYSR